MSTLIETVRVRDGVAPLWGLHLRRLVASCRTLGVPFPGAFDVPAGPPDRVRRLEVGPKGATVTERPVGSNLPVQLITARTTHRPYPHKTTDRKQFDAALEEANAAGVDDVVMLTGDGWVTECAIWGLFWWEGPRLCTPPLSLGVLPGVGRARLADLMGGLEERRVRPGEILGKGLFVANAARGMVEVAALDSRAVAADPRTRELAKRFWSLGLTIE